MSIRIKNVIYSKRHYYEWSGLTVQIRFYYIETDTFLVDVKGKEHAAARFAKREEMKPTSELTDETKRRFLANF